MKRFLLLALLVPTIAFARPVSFNFASVNLIVFAEATFKSILGRDYVISPEVVAMDRKITVSVKTMDSEDVPKFVENLLLQQGIKTVQRGSVFYLEPLVDVRQVNAEQKNKDLEQKPISAIAKIIKDEADAPSVTSNKFVSQAEQSDSEIDENAETRIYTPQNRPSDFILNILVSVYGKKVAQLSGSDVLISAAPAKLEKIFMLLDKIDKFPRLVDISISWVEVSRNDGAARGVSLMSKFLGAKFGIELGSLRSDSLISLKGANFEVVVDALNTDSRFNQVSNSHVVGDDYKKINLIVGDETPTVASTGKDNAGNGIQNIVYRPSGTIVEVTPKVLGSGKINLLIDGQISSFKSTSTGVTGSPTLIKRQVKTEVTAGAGEVLLIGGLNDSQKTDGKSGLFFLPDSWAVKSTQKTETDLVLVLSAKLAK